MNCDRCNKATKHLRIVIVVGVVQKYCLFCQKWQDRNWKERDKRDEWNSLSGQESKEGVKP